MFESLAVQESQPLRGCWLQLPEILHLVTSGGYPSSHTSDFAIDKRAELEVQQLGILAI